MLAEIKKALSDFSSGLAEALSSSINLIRSLFKKQKEESSGEEKTSRGAGEQGISASSAKPMNMNKLFNNDVSTKEVLEKVDSHTQRMQMSGPLAQTQKLAASQKNAAASEEVEASTSSKKITLKPPGFKN